MEDIPMPCNLAVSIAKAAVSDERLRALLTPEAVKDVVLNFLKQQYAANSPALLSSNDTTLYYRLGSLVLTIENGVVRVNESAGNRVFAERVAAEVSRLLAAAADRLFQQRVQMALQSVTTRAQVVDVNYEGRTQKAAVFSINM
jgi:hypothetical protein